MTDVDLGYRPRPQFVPYHKRRERWACIVAHRRAGKTVACIADLIDGCLRADRPEWRAAYVAPTYSQAKDVVWGYVKRYALLVPGTRPHEDELRIDFPNGARLRLYGADNYDRLRGLYFDDVVLDEYADMDPRAWPEVIRPTLSDRQGRATFIGTPRGHNDFWCVWAGNPERGWAGAKNGGEWFPLLLKASETGLIPQPELASARAMLGEAIYLQEYECSFDSAVKGAIYAQELVRAREQGRIGKVPIDPALEVWTAWDLGHRNATAIWFGQTAGAENRLVDYYEVVGGNLEMFVKDLRAKSYLYGAHYLPHDVEVHELSAGGKSRRQVLGSLGVDATVVPLHSLEDGIAATKRFLATCWIDEHRCRRGLEALQLYRFDYDESARLFKRKPAEDWTTHAADALRQRAVTGTGASLRRDKYSRPDTPRGSWMTA